MSSQTLFYDDSLREAVRVVATHLTGVGETCTFLRDGQGRLHVYAPGLTGLAELEKLDAELRTVLGGYAPAFGPVVRAETPVGEPSLLVLDDRRVRYIERRFAGADWASKPTPLATPPRLVFYSVKGGVGRTTALAVLATSLASQGKNVLAVDLDLEAPGLGAALLAETDLPEFGALDWLTEQAIQGRNTPPREKIASVSAIVRDSGRIDVVPAFGKRCLDNPAGVLSKLARVVIESDQSDTQQTFGTRVSELIELLVSAQHYDAVLIDARAGLSEISAAPLLGLGADVLFFMSDSTQSFATYTALLAHLQRFAPVKSDLPDDDDWRLRIKAVRGRVGNPGDPKAAAAFDDRCYRMFSETIYDAESESGDIESLTFDPDDKQAPHSAVPIAFDPRFQLYEPLTLSDQVRAEVWRPAFGEFLAWCFERLNVEMDL